MARKTRKTKSKTTRKATKPTKSTPRGATRSLPPKSKPDE